MLALGVRQYARRGLSSFLVGVSCTLLVALAGVTAVRSQATLLLMAAPLAALALPLLLGPLHRARRARELRYVVTDQGLAVVDAAQRPLATFAFDALERARVERRADGTGDVVLPAAHDALGFRVPTDPGFYGVPDVERFLAEARAAQDGAGAEASRELSLAA